MNAKKAILLLFILLSFLFSGCSQNAKIIVKERLITPKKRKLVNLKKIKDCVMEKDIHFGDINSTTFWVKKEKLAECSNVSMKRKDKNIFYERQNRR